MKLFNVEKFLKLFVKMLYLKRSILNKIFFLNQNFSGLFANLNYNIMRYLYYKLANKPEKCCF